jgi:hypothetical protein
MNPSASVVSVHLAGEGRDEIALDALPGKFTVTRTDEALTADGGLAGWSGFLKPLGIIERLADQFQRGPGARDAAQFSVGGTGGRQTLQSCALGHG